MKVKRVELENYRKYEEVRVECDRDVNIVMGENAEGKRNLVE
ncbi:AAA family ATPase [Staphylococcus haemolyticus]